MGLEFGRSSRSGRFCDHPPRPNFSCFILTSLHFSPAFVFVPQPRPSHFTNLSHYFPSFRSFRFRFIIPIRSTSAVLAFLRQFLGIPYLRFHSLFSLCPYCLPGSTHTRRINECLSGSGRAEGHRRLFP
jgi:hypothetical protein